MDIFEFLKRDFKEYYSQNIYEQIRRSSDLNIKQTAANSNNNNRHDELVKKVNDILTKYNLETITKEHIRFFPGIAGNTNIGETLQDLKLSDILYDYYYPKTEEINFSHYTSIEALEKILGSNKLRLYSPLKRKDEGEFKLFYSDHNLKGYSLEEIQGVTFDECLMSELFYISLTETNNESSDQIDWCYENFGNNEGVKINLKIRSSHTDFRNVFYSGNNKNLVKEIADMIKQDFGVEFVYYGLSKIGAFYIDKAWIDENETRFLIKKWADNYITPFNFNIHSDNQIPYIELPFTSSFADISVVNIDTAVNTDIDEVKNILSNHANIKLNGK